MSICAGQTADLSDVNVGEKIKITNIELPMMVECIIEKPTELIIEAKSRFGFFTIKSEDGEIDVEPPESTEIEVEKEIAITYV